MNILFVCIGNICRSPTLEAICKSLAQEKKIDVFVDSCGIGWAHLGQKSDLRSVKCAQKYGVFIDHTAQQFQDAFFDAFDLILTVDQDIQEQLILKSPTHKEKILLASHYSKNYKGAPIPDPYYMGESGFDEVFALCKDCCEGLLHHLAK